MMPKESIFFDKNADKCELPDDTLYSIYSVGNSGYQEWQADLLDFSFHRSNQPGTLLRLISDDSLQPRKIFPSQFGFTLVTPDFSKIDGSKTWKVMNKPGSIEYFVTALSDSFKFRNRNSTVLLLDPDMVISHSYDPRHKFDCGEVFGQTWHGYAQHFCVQTSICPHLCPRLVQSDSGPVMFPIAIKMSDLCLICSTVSRFAKLGYLKCNSWMADMSAFVTAMVFHGLKMRQNDDLGLCSNWVNRDNAEAPILHYCQPMYDKHAHLIWDKRSYQRGYTHGDDWAPVPSPDLACNRVDRDVLKFLRLMIDEYPSPRQNLNAANL